MPHRPPFAEFAELARAHTVVPVYRRLVADALTPVSAFWAVREPGGCFLFESVAGGERVLLIGADCPDLTRRRLAAAAAALGGHDAMIHPARDGGYALLGLARFDPSLFSEIAWSTSGVAAATIARIEALGWSLHVGDTLRDIDEPGDLL